MKMSGVANLRAGLGRSVATGLLRGGVALAASVGLAAAAHAQELALPSAWMPEDWDQEAYANAQISNTPEDVFKNRQLTLATVPFSLYMMGQDKSFNEEYQPLWVWWTALRSC